MRELVGQLNAGLLTVAEVSARLDAENRGNDFRFYQVGWNGVEYRLLVNGEDVGNGF